jgi:hypothetical protein
VAFECPCVQRREVSIPAGGIGCASLSFHVPALWKPAEHLPGSTDERLLGIAVHSVAIA